jgi:hypothetical protein
MSDRLRVCREIPSDHDESHSIVEAAFKGTSEVGSGLAAYARAFEDLA